jgi:geranylgeranyl diphosphate synthase, type I
VPTSGTPLVPSKGQVAFLMQAQTQFLNPPAELLDIAARTNARVGLLLDAEITRWNDIDPLLADPLESLRALVLAGGKRLRPAFCYWAHVGAGGDPSDPIVVDAGAGLELLHTFALVHDDIMDGSLNRRGMRAVHKQFEDAHRANGWRAEERRFGEGVAILVGDLAFVYADLLLTNVNPEAAAIYNELRIEVNIGQYLDLVGTVRGGPTVESARRICRYKSGKYTIERPLHLGASLAGGLVKYQDALSAYGLPLGEAFQLRDDLLGAMGDESLTGKPVGDDLREGKPTSLVARALEASDATQRTALARIGHSDLQADEVTELQQIFTDTGAAAAVEADITLLRDEAIDAITKSGLLPNATNALVDLAHYVTNRDH